MSERSQRERRAGVPALAPGRLPEDRARLTREERDRTLSRIRATTAVTGIGAVLVGGALVGWLEHGVSDEAATSTSTSTDGSTSSSSDDSLTSPTTAPESSTGSGSSDSTQPGVTSGGS